MPTIAEVISVVEDFAHPAWQEAYDNTGWQTMLAGQQDEECTGALVCVDVTPGIIREAVSKGCNLVITHHPLIFKGVKRLTGMNRVDSTVIEAVRSGVAVYSSHTALDSAPGGISWVLAEKLGLTDVVTLDPRCNSADRGTVGIGTVGTLSSPLDPIDFVELVKRVCDAKVARCSGIPSHKISRVAICGGAGGEYISEGARLGVDAVVTSDVKHNLFLDDCERVMTVDVGHYETESCAKEIFYGLIHKKFPNFALYCSETEKNPITYI